MKTSAHPNKIPFQGVLTHVDVPSDKAPGGSRGHRVMLTRAATEEALEGLIGQAVDFKTSWDGHDARQKCGVIMHAWLDGNAVMVSGHIYGRDFPEIQKKLLEPDCEMGMSYEMADARVENMRTDVWKLTHFTFTGAAIMLAKRAAYRTSKFVITAAAERFTGKLSFIEQRIKTGRAVPIVKPH